MVVTVNRGEPQISETVVIQIEDSRYRRMQSVDGRLHVIKISDGLSDEIAMCSRTSNEIDIL